MKKVQVIFSLLLLCLFLNSGDVRADDGSLEINNQTIHDQGNSPQTTKSKNIPELFLTRQGRVWTYLWKISPREFRRIL